MPGTIVLYYIYAPLLEGSIHDNHLAGAEDFFLLFFFRHLQLFPRNVFLEGDGHYRLLHQLLLVYFLLEALFRSVLLFFFCLNFEELHSFRAAKRAFCLVNLMVLTCSRYFLAPLLSNPFLP